MSEYNIQMNKYNALNAEYDQLYPVTKIEDVDGLDTALQKKADTSSVYTKTEADTLLATKAEFILLWENASPTSEFATQTLSVNTDGCLGIIVSFVGRTTYFGSTVGQDIVNMTIGTEKMTIWQNSSLINYRGFKWVSTSEILFYDAMEISEYGNSSTRIKINKDAIPYRIYGIKV